MVPLALLGTVLILLGEGLTFVHILPWSHYVFPLVWYGYILLLDSLNHWLSGRSLILERRREFCVMLAISACYWYVFEWYNLVIRNWTYINPPEGEWIGIGIKLVSFATVIPAIYETATLLEILLRPLGKFETATAMSEPPSILFPWRPILFLAAGLLLSILPLFLPELFFWSVWIGLFLLLDPINDWLGRPSMVRDWQAGRLRRTLIFLAAGYICGFFWEFWNYWAYTKWVYTVPLPEMPHIFEMPALGFLGFGPFALETFAFWTLVWGVKRKDQAR